MKSLFTFWVLVFGLGVNLFSRPVLSPELEALLSSKTDGVISVIAEFKNPGFKIPSSESPVQVQRRLRQVASEVQGDLLKEISQRKKTAPAIKIKSFWIDNSMALTARISRIKNLIQREDITNLYLDQEITLFDPIEPGSKKIQEPEDSTYGLKTIRAMQVWEDLNIDGTGVVVGLLDTGIDINHPDLEGRVLKTKDFVSDYEDDVANDGNGHGTHCAGTIGGKRSGSRAIGVAPGVRFIVGKIFSDEGKSTFSQIKSAMQWIVDPDNDPLTAPPMRVISNSWGGRAGVRFQAVIDTWRALGVAPVFAAGNSGPRPKTVRSPGTYSNVITVGATDSDDEIARFSARGPFIFKGKTYIKPDISAPGVDVYSASPGAGYQTMSGTSMATPHVAGVVALMLQADPKISVEHIKDYLKASSVDLGEKGEDNDFGWGRLDAYNAVSLVLSAGEIHCHISSGDKPATIQIGPKGRIYAANDMGQASFHLRAGTYELTLRAFGYETKTVSVTVTAKKILEVSTNLKPSRSFETSFIAKNSDGVSLNARFSFPGLPVAGGSTGVGGFKTRLPAGKYQVKVQSMGYTEQVKDFTVNADEEIIIVMQDLPPFLLFDRDWYAEHETFYMESLDALGLRYDHVKNIGRRKIMGYENIILWTSLISSPRMIMPYEQTMLMDYVGSGGRLFITGQEIGRRYQERDFFKHLLGATYVDRKALVKEIIGQGMRFKLDGGDSASNQRWPDVIRVSDALKDRAEVLFSYREGGPAGLLNTYGDGKVVYFPFGFEGINGIQNRIKVMTLVRDVLRPSLKDRLDRIQWAFKNDRELFQVLIRQIRLREVNLDKLRHELSARKFKTPFRTLMGQLLEKRH